MKRIIYLLAILLSSFLFSVRVLAETPTYIPTPAPPAKAEYNLPYPGILPDHPLYFLKQIRDRILDYLIVDPTRKAEFYILQADKRLSMGISLFQEKKYALSETTISKGETYMSLAVASVAKMKTAGTPVGGSLLGRLIESTGKHLEVLEGMLAKSPDAQKQGLKSSVERLKKLQGEIDKLK